MAKREVIVVGASAGGIPALTELCRGLSPRLEAALLVVVHTSPTFPSYLPEILNRAGPLTAMHAHDGQRIVNGHIYVAPPNHHMLLEDGRIRLSVGPRENGFRPAIDPLFRSAAEAHGPQVIGLILSGGRDDGTDGMLVIKESGGMTIVQDPQEATTPNMPQSVIDKVPVDHVLPVRLIPAMLRRLTIQPIKQRVVPMSGRISSVGGSNGGEEHALRDREVPGKLSPLTGPECGGALWERQHGKLVAYQCHVGHRYTEQGMLSEHAEAVEGALWSALRALEESAELKRRMAQRARQGKLHGLAGNYQRSADRTEHQATAIRTVLMNHSATDSPGPSRKKLTKSKRKMRRK